LDLPADEGRIENPGLVAARIIQVRCHGPAGQDEVASDAEGPTRA
jgi:hypothetical protein